MDKLVVKLLYIAGGILCFILGPAFGYITYLGIMSKASPEMNILGGPGFNLTSGLNASLVLVVVIGCLCAGLLCFRDMLKGTPKEA